MNEKFAANKINYVKSQKCRWAFSFLFFPPKIFFYDVSIYWEECELLCSMRMRTTQARHDLTISTPHWGPSELLVFAIEPPKSNEPMGLRLQESGVASQGKDRREKLAAELFLFIFDSRPRRPGSTAHLQRPARDAALVRHRLSWYNSQDSRGLSWKGSRGIGRHKVKTTARRFHYNLCINWPFELRSLTRKIFFDFNFITRTRMVSLHGVSKEKIRTIYEIHESFKIRNSKQICMEFW